MTDWKQIFSRTTLRELFPQERTDAFFDALFGDASEGAYDIELSFDRYDRAARNLRFLLNLRERPGRCLACNLTYGLPEVFARHPVIDLKGLVRDIEGRLGGEMVCGDWRLGRTVQQDNALHSIPLEIEVRQA
ncbi:MAG: pancreas/duodenum homeobox protein 1 [Desulfobulbaceae bacterium]|jgi:hypothetical protein|nr:pancreas/duodenum homeobox protein 1 [Desulfobulbaceae bacterium]